MKTRFPFAAHCLFLVLVSVLAFGSATSRADEDEPEGGGKSKPTVDAPLPASDEGKQAMGGFRKPTGWSVSLFAAEPALANPVAMTIDNQGRVFVCESFRQDRGVTDNRGHDQEWLMADLAAQSVQDRIDYHKRLLGSELPVYTAHDDRIRLLEDTDGDGQVDRDTVFADGFNQLEDGTGAGILVRGHSAYYTCIPKLWQLTDADGDGVAEDRQILHDGYGVRVAFRGHDSHGLIIGPDGRLYFSIGDRGYNLETPAGRLKDPESGAVFRCELDGSRLEVFATGLRNPQELAFDDYGYLFTGDNNSDSGDKARWVGVMQGGDSGWRMMYQYISDRGPFNREKLWHPFSEDTPAYIVPPIANIGDGPSGLACYPGSGLTGDFDNCFLMVDFRGGASNSGVRLIRTQPQGAFWQVERSEELLWNILATDVTFGPDGGIWVCDWVDGWVGEGKGRVYRFADSTAQQQQLVGEVQELLAAGFSQLSPERLGELLKHVDRRVRLEAQWELSTRGRISEFTQLAMDSSASTLPRMHAVWGLGHAARLNPDLGAEVSVGLKAALADNNLDVRAAAANVVGDLRLPAFADTIVGLIGDSEPRVQYAACLAAGQLQLDAAFNAVTTLLEANADSDPGLRHAGIMALKGMPQRHRVVGLKNHPSRSVRVAAVVALRKLQDTDIAEFLSDIDPVVRLEAARAVHDVPELHGALPALASLKLTPAAADPLAHRWLNANFRLAGEEAAELIAQFAADSGRSEAMRIEAIQMLGTWAQPGKLDRVMNRFQPLEDRDGDKARTACLTHLPQLFVGTDAVIQATIEAATALGIEQAGETLISLALDASQDGKLRSSALAGFAKMEPEAALELVSELVNDDQPVVRARAIGLLAQLAPERAVPVLQAATESTSIAVRQAAWDALASVDTPAAVGLIDEGAQRYMAGGLPPDVWLNVVEAAKTRSSETIRGRLTEFEEQAVANNALEAYRTSTFGGDAAAGKDLFFNKTELSCVRCHKIADTGGEVGPVLTQIGKQRDNRYLLESIVHPDAKIAENFETAVLLTEDNEILTGILRKETPTVVELINADGKVIEIDPLEVVSRRKGKSAMPADLIKLLKPRELRDLVAYLSSLK
ncbi:MAG: HEAT repeat domain-containing protein [Pirellulaceae bacterium]